MAEFWTTITQFIAATKIPEQIGSVDYGGLFSNWYFLVPFLLFIGYQLYKQAFTNIVLVAIAMGLWVFSGSSYMQDLVVNGEIQISKILPVAGIWLLAVSVAVYLLFMRSD